MSIFKVVKILCFGGFWSLCVGVTSFNIDFAAKKVTVTGDVTPLTVLASISKVKNAQVWPETIQK